MPEIGMQARVRAVVAPIANFKERVMLWAEGDEAEVTWSGFWAGQLERGAITLLEDPNDSVVLVPAAFDSVGSGGLGEERSDALLAEASAESGAGREGTAEAQGGSVPEVAPWRRLVPVWMRREGD